MADTNSGEQLTLLRETVRRSATKEPPGLAASLPVARVAVDVSLSHLDRPFDYLVPADLDDLARPGCRIKVRFSGKDVDGFILERVEASDHGGRLAPIRRVVSAEQVLSPEVADLCRVVADRYAGVFADVTRLAVPPRHAKVESEPCPITPLPDLPPPSRTAWTPYPFGPSFLDALTRLPPTPADSPQQPVPDARRSREQESAAAETAQASGPSRVTGVEVSQPGGQGRRNGAEAPEPGSPGRRNGVQSAQPGGSGGRTGADGPRAVWGALPGADWAMAFAEAARAALESGRGALLLAPDARDLDRLAAACRTALGPEGFVSLSADLGPTARYRAFLTALRGRARVVIGTRAAAFAPVARLGLVAIWDDGDDSYAEPRAPYPHAREVLLLRAHRQRCAALIGGTARSAEAAALLETGWAHELVADRQTIRAVAPAVHVAGESDHDLARDGAARAARLPHQAFEAARAGLQSGPVLIQVPRAGYLPSLVCQTCRTPARCQTCSGALRRTGEAQALSCTVCGRDAPDYRCPECGDTRLRAVVVGARRTAEELGRAFPGTPVRTSGGDAVLDTVPARPALVVATPGAEPRADGGYSAALLLDTWLLLARPELRAAEEAARRWFNAATLVRRDGTVVMVGEPAAAPLQALVRWSPEGYAARELAERQAAGLPPATRLAELTGPADAVTDVLDRAGRTLGRLRTAPHVLGPVPVGDDTVRALVTVPRTSGQDLARALHEAQAARGTKKLPGTVRIRLDPASLT